MKLVLYLFIALITILSCGEKQEEKEKPSKENSFFSKAKIVRNQNKPKDAEQVFLRFAPVEGTSKKMKLEMNSEFAGQEMDIFTSMEQFFIKKHDNGDVDSKANYSDFRMQLMGRTITMDDNPELRELGKSTVFIRSNSLGKTIDVQCDNPDLQRQFEQFDGIAAIYPKDELFLGDSWSSSQVLNNNGISIKMHSTYTLKAIGKTSCTIDLESVGKASSMKMEMSGSLIIEKETGYIIHGQINQTIDMPQGEGRNSIKIEVN